MASQHIAACKYVFLTLRLQPFLMTCSSHFSRNHLTVHGKYLPKQACLSVLQPGPMTLLWTGSGLHECFDEWETY